MPAPKRRAAVYARVSALDGGRDIEDQLRRLRARCERAGYRLVAEFVEREGADGQAMAALLAAADRGEFDLVLFWSLDRFGLDGAARTVG